MALNLRQTRSGFYQQQPTGYASFVPSQLPPQPGIILDEALQKKLSQADRSLARLDGLSYVLPNRDLFISMFVKKEALLSSQIEGTQATLENVLEFEKNQPVENIDDVAEVINYVKALNYGIGRLDSFPMSTRLIKELHEILMDGVRGTHKTPGEFKKTQNWIGPVGCTLQNATYVPPTSDETLVSMSELEKYMHSADTYPALIDCALIHYQFETIHPFLDGNGRLGRLLITFYLYWKKVLDQPLLYLSFYFKKHRAQYYDLLNSVRSHGNYESWISFFLDAVIATSDSAIKTAKDILKLHQDHRSLLSENKLSAPLAVDILEHLFYQPIVTIKELAEHFDVAYTSVANILTHFEQMGIVKEVTGKKRGKRYSYEAYLTILSEGTDPL